MQTKLDSVGLRNGETMEIIAISAPDTAGDDKLAPFLGHKGDPWLWHIKKAFRGETPYLETRSYVGIVDGKYVGNISTIEKDGIGILCHVYTSPEKRRLSIASTLMRAVVKDFNERNGKAMYLGTSFDSPAYWIYHGFGFRSMAAGSGSMELLNDETLYDTYFKSPVVRVEGLTWTHWLSLAVLGACPGRHSKIPSVRMTDRSCYEGAFIELMKACEDGTGQQVSVAVDETGKTGACMSLTELTGFLPSAVKQYRLDLFQHPDFIHGAEMLLDSCELPDGKTLAFIEENEQGRSAEGKALIQAGFRIEGRLMSQIKGMGDGSDLDVTIYGIFR